jgi:hypothetical protein
VTHAETLAAFRRGDNAEAERLARLDLAAADADGDADARVDALCMLSRVALRSGDFAELEARAEEAEHVARAAATPGRERMPVHLRAVAARMTGRYDEARALYLRSIALNDELGESAMAAAEHRNLAYLDIRAGNAARARELFAESARRFTAVDAPAMAPYLTFDQATIAYLDGDHRAAAERLAAAEAEWAQQGAVPDPDDAAEIADLRDRLGAAHS